MKRSMPLIAFSIALSLLMSWLASTGRLAAFVARFDDSCPDGAEPESGRSPEEVHA